MHRYGSSKPRLVILAALLAAGVWASRTSLGQSPASPIAPASPVALPAAGPTAAPAASTAYGGVFHVIMENQDPVFYTIVLLSIIGVTLIIQGFIKNRASVMMPAATTAQIREMISQRRFDELMQFTETDPGFISKAVNAALKRAPNFTVMKEAMETSVAEQTAEQFRRIEYLNIIGNLGPLLGLLGTVLGMIDAFSVMAASGGHADPAQLAGGISKALAHTLLGLTLAVPCLAAFGVLRTIVDRLTIAGALEAEELLLMIRPAEAQPAGTAARPTPPGITATGAARKPSPVPAPSPAV
jgi:biopolymer transport protein ExbB